MLWAALIVSVVATLLKVGDATHRGATHLATSLVADVQLIAAAVCWVYAAQVSSEGMTRSMTAVIVSLCGGALVAYVVSVTLLIIETVSAPRR